MVFFYIIILKIKFSPKNKQHKKNYIYINLMWNSWFELSSSLSLGWLTITQKK